MKIIIDKKEAKVLKGIFISFFALILIFSILIHSIDKYKKQKVVTMVEKEVHNLIEINEKYKKIDNEKKLVDNFNLFKDTLPFGNFISPTSKGGNCEGYNMFEMLNFNNKDNLYLGENKVSSYNGNLGDLVVSEEDEKLVYNTITKSSTPKDYREIIEIAYGFKNNKSKTQSPDEFLNKDFENKDFKDILTDIRYLHDTKGYTRLDTLPYNSIYWEDKLENKQQKYGIDISSIIDNIDNNKLIVIGLSNGYSGHALLVYGYEYIDKNNIKLLVKDSNFPLITKEAPNDDEIQYNNEIEKECYVLFTKDILKDDWSYIYNPIIKNTVIYEQYNSFMPSSILSIINN